MFTSARERRLWLWVLATVVAIYATLGLARTLAGVLRDRNLLDKSFIAALGVLAVVVVIQAVRTKPGGYEISIAIAVAAVYAMVLVRMGLPEERTHLFEYGLVAVLIFYALTERRDNGRPVRAPAILAVLATTLVGWLDEGIQWVMPTRVYDWVDVGFNALAALMAVLATVALRWAKSRRQTPTVKEDRAG